jgi:hypothetical protein
MSALGICMLVIGIPAIAGALSGMWTAISAHVRGDSTWVGHRDDYSQSSEDLRHVHFESRDQH